MTSLFSVEGKVVVVTGGTSGIGYMAARGLVEAGATVYVASRKVEACERVAAELGELGTCHAAPADLSTEDGCRSLADAVARQEKKLDVLVNNAGATWGAPLAEHDEQAWERVLALNVKGVSHLTRFLEPLLRAAGTADAPARVINVGSIEGIRVPVTETFSYSASKAAVHQLTRHLAKVLAPVITVNAIAPGPFESRMMAAMIRQDGDRMVKHSPMKRLGRPDDIVGAIVYLSSAASAYVTGTILAVDGGAATVA
jgi:NAD(P)-dependent dehydrogenase (short-subunit alcohol dehydrogenase family)